VACNQGHFRAADAPKSGSRVLSRTKGSRRQSRRHIQRMPYWHRNRCANVRALCLALPFVDPPPPSSTCSVYHIPPRSGVGLCAGGFDNAPESRSTCCNAACAAAISSIDDATLSMMKIGFAVSPRPRRMLAVACKGSSAPSACEGA
jgi:hypothetical protein